MGRRSVHTPDELREAIVEAATTIIAQHGHNALSAREIARQIGYSPGTLYNIFENIDDILLTIELRLLDRLIHCIQSREHASDPESDVRQMATIYVEFAQTNDNLWTLLTGRRQDDGVPTPQALETRIQCLHDLTAAAIKPIVGDAPEASLKRAATVVWAALHGATSIAATRRCPQLTHSDVRPVIEDFMTFYLTGLKALAAR